MKINGIVQLSVSSSQDEISALLTDGDFNQVFIECDTLDQRTGALGIFTFVQQLLHDKKIAKFEPIVVSIASVPPRERNSLVEFFIKADVSIVALSFEKYAALAAK